MIVGVIIGYLYGGVTGYLQALIFFMGVDIVTGITVAIKNKNPAINSKIALLGGLKKVNILLCVAIGHIIDVHLLKTDIMQTAITLFFIGNEGISIIENYGKIGLPFPKKLKAYFEQLREKSDEE